jgi:hypothetical protein
MILCQYNQDTTTRGTGLFPAERRVTKTPPILRRSAKRLCGAAPIRNPENTTGVVLLHVNAWHTKMTSEVRFRRKYEARIRYENKPKFRHQSYFWAKKNSTTWPIDLCTPDERLGATHVRVLLHVQY